MLTRLQMKNDEGFSDFVRAPGTHAAVTVLIADASAIAVNGDGLIGFGLVGVGAAAVAYLVARLRRPLAGRQRSVRRVQEDPMAVGRRRTHFAGR
jgi:hypothetical protein